MSFYDEDDWTPGRIMQSLFQDGRLTNPGGANEFTHTRTHIRDDGTITQQQVRKDNDMKLTNTEAEDLARDILSGRRTEGLREHVEAAVTHLTELFAGAGDGSIFSFGRDVSGRTYHYAAIKSGGKWFSTGNATALKGGDDDELITWLVGLEIYDEADLLALAKTDVPALIEGSVTDDREPQPGDGPGYHADHRTWEERHAHDGT